MDAAADRLLLIAAPGVEVLAVSLVLLVAALAILVSAVMAWRGRVEGWSLVGLFGLVGIAAVLMLAHLPTRLVFDRDGAEVGYWGFHAKRPWSEFTAVNVQRRWDGLLVRFVTSDGAGRLFPWSQWPGLYAPQAGVEPRLATMRIESWRLRGK